MPANADRELRRHGDRLDNIEDQLATIEQRLTRAGFPRDTRPPAERHDITAPGFPDDDERGYRPPNFPPDAA